jgi:hypothetical protein
MFPFLFKLYSHSIVSSTVTYVTQKLQLWEIKAIVDQCFVI